MSALTKAQRDMIETQIDRKVRTVGGWLYLAGCTGLTARYRVVNGKVRKIDGDGDGDGSGDGR